MHAHPIARLIRPLPIHDTDRPVHRRDRLTRLPATDAGDPPPPAAGSDDPRDDGAAMPVVLLGPGGVYLRPWPRTDRGHASP